MPKWIAILLFATATVFGQSTQTNRSDRIACAILPKGKLLKMVKPIYPPEAKEKATVGTVTVELTDKQVVPRTVRVKPALVVSSTRRVNIHRAPFVG